MALILFKNTSKNLIWSPPPPPLPRYARRFFLLRPPLFFSIELFYCQNSYIQKFSICQNSQNLEILNIQKFSKSRNSQYTKISKTPIKIWSWFFMYLILTWCVPLFSTYLYIYILSQKKGDRWNPDILLFCCFGKLLKFSIYRNSQYTEILKI